ncbi:MAG: glycoside hydrolase family 25 protein, partial [Eubacteriales bacterium]|nr:glycoside hydrolase family 25 protein [Eubacteriales bacterium]
STVPNTINVEMQYDAHRHTASDQTNQLEFGLQAQSYGVNSYAQGMTSVADTATSYRQMNTWQAQNHSAASDEADSPAEEDSIVNIESRDDDGVVYDLDLLTGQELLDRLIYDESTTGDRSGERSLKDGWTFDEKTQSWRYAQKNGYLKGGVYTIGDTRFVFDDQGRLANNKWLKFVQDGILRYALAKPVQSNSSVPMTSNVYAAELYTAENGLTYGFTASGYLGHNQWIQLKSDKSLVFANGEAGIIIKDGVAQIDHQLYAFDKTGRLVDNSWAQVNNGRDYVLAKKLELKPNSIKPSKSNLYQQEVYLDQKTKQKHVFNARGYIAKNQWVQLKDGVFVFGQGNNGAPLSNGVYKIKDKIYAFNNQGQLANNKMLAYGKHKVRTKVVKSHKGIPESNTFANTVIVDGQKTHLINANGFIAQNQWVKKKNGSFAFGSGMDGTPLVAGVYKINKDLYAFNKNGELAKNTWLAMSGGRKVLTTDIRTYRNRPTGGNVRHSEIYQDARTQKQYLFNTKGFLARNEWVKKSNGRYSFGSGDAGTPVKDGIYRFGKDDYFAFTPSGDLANNEYVNFTNGARTFAKPVRLMNNQPVGGNVYRDGRYRINGELKQFTKGGYLVNKTGNFVAGPTISVSQQQYMAYERCEKNGRLYLAGSDGRVITTSLNVNGRIIPIDKYDGHVLFNDGWQHVSGKEYYFFNDTSIAKPYEKVGGAYVNGSYGSRINAKAKGIDISAHQGKINFDEVKRDGVDFVFIRSGYATSTDTHFFENIREAKRVGLKVGVYVYSYAKTPEEAREEARYAASLLRGHKLDLPLVYDIEDKTIENAVPSRQGRSDLIRAFCNEVKSQGYKPMVYTNPSWLNQKLEYNIRNEYDIWLAHWADKPRYQTEFWQASEKGKVKGIQTNVDIDFMFTDFHRYL